MPVAFNVDENKAVTDFLLADSSITDSFGSRIWGGRDVPPPTYKPADGPGLCLKSRGGLDDYTDVVMHPSMQIKVYGATEAVANASYRLLHQRLQNARSADILWARREVTGQLLREPDTEWVFVLVFYKVMLRDLNADD